MISSEVSDKLHSLQRRCIICGSTYALHKHHRVFRSEGDKYLKRLLDKYLPIYRETYGLDIKEWELDDIQNLCVLCNECHEDNKKGVHGCNVKLNKALKLSFTHPKTGENVFYKKRINKIL